MGTISRRDFLKGMGLAAAAGWAPGLRAARGAAPADGRRLNVLFIASDDLRFELGCYGDTQAVTPNLDALARRGTLFTRAYCQQAVCNPSRASLLTGLRPDTIRVWDLPTHFRDTTPDAVTLPQHFRQNGYFAQGIGKIFHNDAVHNKKGSPPMWDPASWSVPLVHGTGPHWADWAVPGEPDAPKKRRGPFQCVDVPDNAYFDGQIADEAVAALEKLKDRPFFLAVGFWKPHLPFNAPKKYWDLYDRSKLAPPRDPRPPRGAPAVALHPWNELRGYEGVPKDGPLTREQTMELRHGYYACISFLDAQVGRLLDRLERLGLVDRTIVVFWSDHGFHLGEHDLWGKTTTFELDTRLPLIVAAPSARGRGARCGALVELVDLYPTLAELAGLPPRSELEGVSLAPLLDDPARPWKKAAFSQHPRPFYGKEKMTTLGYSLRTDRWRYTEWRRIADGRVEARELYDHRDDPGETVNVIDEPGNAGVAEDLAKALRAGPAAARPPKQRGGL